MNISCFCMVSGYRQGGGIYAPGLHIMRPVRPNGAAIIIAAGGCQTSSTYAAFWSGTQRWANRTVAYSGRALDETAGIYLL
ncbi:hypothetical protein [Bombella favorum]|nr:hypothetical protein [Bombella favorum]